jgi:uncharacterized protein YcfJ
MMNRLKSPLSASAAIAITLSATSCQTPGESAFLGGALGAGAGALIGNQSGSAAEGALIGGAIGSGGGYLMGKEQQRNGRTNYRDPRYNNNQRYQQPYNGPSRNAPYY